MSETKKKGNKTTEIVVGAAAVKLTSAVKAIKEANQSVEKLEQTLTDYTIRVSDYEDRISNLKTDYEQKKAEQDFKLQLDYKTSQREFSEKFLTENGMKAVVQVDLSDLEDSYRDLKFEFTKKLEEETAKVRSAAFAKAEADRKLMEAEYKAKEAQNLAKIDQLTSQLTFCESQSKLWKESLDEERKASVERSKAAAIGSVNVGNPNGR